MERTAKCQCEGFRVTVTGEPAFTIVCHCEECQRRSGVPLTSNAYFHKSNIRLEGEKKVYTRPANEGRSFHNYFCPNCGSTICWTLDVFPDLYGVATGAFNDPTFHPPSMSIYERSKYAWVSVPNVEHYQGMPNLDQLRLNS